MHCHLLAGLDDGPRTEEDALEMCRIACAEGTSLACATAHQNERWNEVTPECIRQGTIQLSARLRSAGVPLTVFPCAEVTAHPDMVNSWMQGRLLSVADRGKYLLVEMPHGLFVDLRPAVRQLTALGVRLILAHPERQDEFLDDPGPLEELIRAGCLVQVSSKSVAEPKNREAGRALQTWFRRGLVHLLGSDGHSVRRRPPRLADAFRQVRGWIGACAADRIGSVNGLAVLQGLPLKVPEPTPQTRRWFSWPW